MLTCSTSELVVLAGLLGAEALEGVPDPFVGWLDDEINAALTTARESLVQRQFLELRSDGTVLMDRAVALVVGTCAYAEAIFVQTYTPAGDQQLERCFYLTSELAVERAPSSTDPGAWDLVVWPDGAAACRRVLEWFDLAGLSEAPAAQGGTIPTPVLTSVTQLAAQAGADRCKVALLQAGLEPATAAAMAATLADPVGNGAVVTMVRQGTSWDVGGMGLLAGRNGLWLLHAREVGDQEWVDLAPVTVEAASAQVLHVLQAAVPAAGTVV